MGQMSIPMLNKVGYSMYWDSMWDNKVNYTRNLKDSIFLNKFMDLFLMDDISINIVDKKLISKKILEKYDFPLYKFNKSVNNKILFKRNNHQKYTSKTWIFRYQKWIILYCFLYSSKYNILKKVDIYKKKKVYYNNNLFYIYNIYSKSLINYNLSFSFYKNSNFKNIF